MKGDSDSDSSAPPITPMAADIVNQGDGYMPDAPEGTDMAPNPNGGTPPNPDARPQNWGLPKQPKPAAPDQSSAPQQPSAPQQQQQQPGGGRPGMPQQGRPGGFPGGRGGFPRGRGGFPRGRGLLETA